MNPDYDWPAVVKKEAKGLNGEDLGEVQQAGDTFVRIGKGFIYKISFFIPKDLIKGFDGHTLRFD